MKYLEERGETIKNVRSHGVLMECLEVYSKAHFA